MPEAYTLPGAAEPRVTIIGAGAMGLLHGAYLSRGGCRVTLVARRPEVAELINAQGIRVEDAQGEQNFKGMAAVSRIEDAPEPDLVLLLVKGPDTAGAMAGAARHIPAGASVLTLQNGLGNIEAIAAEVPEEQILAGVSYTGGTLLGPGHVRMGGLGQTHIGELGGKMTPRLLALAQIFERSGLPAVISENIQGLIWTKVLVNAGINPLAALTRLKNGDLVAMPESRVLMSILVAEGAHLAGRLGISLSEPDPVAHTLEVAHRTGNNLASMLQDIMQNKKTEIESINGKLVEKGSELGLTLPLNHTVTLLIRLLEHSISKGA